MAPRLLPRGFFLSNLLPSPYQPKTWLHLYRRTPPDECVRGISFFFVKISYTSTPQDFDTLPYASLYSFIYTLPCGTDRQDATSSS